MAATFGGVFSVLPTPFDSSGKIDVGSLRRVVDMFVGAGVNGLTALGVTSEVGRLNDTERLQVLKTVLEHVAGRVPVVVGATAEGLAICVEYAQKAKEEGAAAVMVSPPRMLKLNSEAVVRHYRALADQVDIEIVVQDYPPISGFAMEPQLLARIAREVPRARTIKLEDPPTPFKTARILEAADGVPVQVLGGLGGVFLFEELMSGAAGAMTGFAYPEMLVAIVTEFRAGRIDQAADLFYRYVPLMRFEFQEGIGMAIRKEVLRRRGVIDDARIRPPGSTIDEKTSEALVRLLTWMRDVQGAKWISV
jgi:4-hydroxy-tetrahydrodipicolinate synthase